MKDSFREWVENSGMSNMGREVDVVYYMSRVLWMAGYGDYGEEYVGYRA